METVKLILSIVQVILAIFIVAVVLLQSSRSTGLSGAIAGGAETFFGKNKGRSLDAKLSKATIWGGIAFALITIAMNVL